MFMLTCWNKNLIFRTVINFKLNDRQFSLLLLLLFQVLHLVSVGLLSRKSHILHPHGTLLAMDQKFMEQDRTLLVHFKNSTYFLKLSKIFVLNFDQKLLHKTENILSFFSTY